MIDGNTVTYDALRSEADLVDRRRRPEVPLSKQYKSFIDPRSVDKRHID